MIIAQPNTNPSINQFLEIQLQLFKGHFLVTQATMDEEAIHQMRLAIKRIRTIRKLNKHIHFPMALSHKIFDAIKYIFAASGHLRDLQIQQGLLAGYSAEMKFSFIFLKNYLAGKEKYFVQLLDKTIHEISFDLFANLRATPENTDKLPENTDIEDESLHFIKHQIGKILRLIVRPENNENIHELRKKVKQLFFVLQFLKNNFPKSSFGKYDLVNLKTIGDSLGQWHDRVVFKEKVMEFAGDMGENFIHDNPEYQILLYVLEDEKRKLLKGLNVNLYLEIINLRFLLGERAPE